MDELIKEMERFKDVTSVFTFTDVAIVLLLSFATSMVIGLVYRATHRGTSYAQSFAQTLVIMSMVTGSSCSSSVRISRAHSLLSARCSSSAFATP